MGPCRNALSVAYRTVPLRSLLLHSLLPAAIAPVNLSHKLGRGMSWVAPGRDTERRRARDLSELANTTSQITDSSNSGETIATQGIRPETDSVPPPGCTVYGYSVRFRAAAVHRQCTVVCIPRSS
ncbi:hypothetical protein C8Q77DRAFT_265218 [Trametes polyzona]|nr:hypothetical protein C8Q77DRAFT_265218 [Trametes polyzona]